MILRGASREADETAGLEVEVLLFTFRLGVSTAKITTTYLDAPTDYRSG